MSNPFVAEIRIFTGNFAPVGWALCNGQLLSISQNTALFSLLGTNYGGNGTTNFALPNLQGAAPLGQGQGPALTNRLVGESGGEPSVTLASSEMPQHSHTMMSSTVGVGAASPSGGIMVAGGRGRPAAYAPPAALTAMSPVALSAAGSSLAHNNMPPYLAFTFIIALEGIFPPR